MSPLRRLSIAARGDRLSDSRRNFGAVNYIGGTRMSFRQPMISARIAIGFVTIAGALTVSAQGPRGGVPEPYTPAKDAKDLKAVLFKWMWAEGMLKGHDERDMVASLEYQGK